MEEKINYLIKHLRYTQALAEITLEKQAKIIAKLEGLNETSVKNDMIAEVHKRVKEIP